MSKILAGLEGVKGLIDDTLIFGKDQEEHDRNLEAALRRIKEANGTLNADKCVFSRHSITFLGHLLDPDGIKPDPEKTWAIQAINPPGSVPELRRFMGMVNQMGKFSPNLAEVTQPLRELLSKRSTWMWGPPQEQAFKQVKDELSRAVTLTKYDVTADMKVSADAS